MSDSYIKQLEDRVEELQKKLAKVEARNAELIEPAIDVTNICDINSWSSNKYKIEITVTQEIFQDLKNFHNLDCHQFIIEDLVEKLVEKFKKKLSI